MAITLSFTPWRRPGWVVLTVRKADYEFSILRATNDSIFLKGRKWHNEMLLTRLPKGTNWEEYMLGLATVMQGMNVETYDFVLGNDTLAQGTLTQEVRRLSVTLGDKKWEMPYCTTNTGISLRELSSLVTRSISTSHGTKKTTR